MKTTKTKILVIPMETGNQTNELGLTLPDELSMQGLEKVQVVYSGNEVEDVAKNNTLLIYKGAGTKVMGGGKEYRVINVTDIVIIYE